MASQEKDFDKTYHHFTTEEEKNARSPVSRDDEGPLRRFDMNLMSFPTPEFRGCNNRDLCEFSNVCFSPRDGLLVFDLPGLREDGAASEAGEEGATPLFADGSRLSKTWAEPRRVKLIPHEIYSGLQNVHFADRMFVGNCQRQPRKHNGGTNPAHWMIGVGRLFVASSGWYGNLSGLDLVLYHQCPSLKNVWPWGRLITENLIYNDALSQGLFRSNSSNNRISLPYIDLPGNNALKSKDLVICGKTVYQDPFDPRQYFGPNRPTAWLSDGAMC